ncbi:MAG: flK [Verrucomicrobiales bacterium]|nr:flK [Verrucomicrobiales bacterium]
MKSAPKIGTVQEMSFLVETKHAIEFAGDGGMPAVLSTPNLIQFLERTARHALLAFQEDTERSVGTEIELRHLAATPVGKSVTCLARIIHVEGRNITFHLEARDEQELIARGSHRRHIVRIDRFAKHVGKKSGA